MINLLFILWFSLQSIENSLGEIVTKQGVGVQEVRDLVKENAQVQEKMEVSKRFDSRFSQLECIMNQILNVLSFYTMCNILKETNQRTGVGDTRNGCVVS